MSIHIRKNPIISIIRDDLIFNFMKNKDKHHALKA